MKKGSHLYHELWQVYSILLKFLEFLEVHKYALFSFLHRGFLMGDIL